MQIILQPLALRIQHSDTLRSLASDISKEFENVQVTVASICGTIYQDHFSCSPLNGPEIK